MSSRFAVDFLPEAEVDLLRFQHFLQDRAETIEAYDAAIAGIAALHDVIVTKLSRAPTIYRPAGSKDKPAIRLLSIPRGRTGYRVLFEIVEGNRVIVAAIEHQRERERRR